MAIDVVLTNDGAYTFVGKMKDIGIKKFNAFSNPIDSPYAHLLKTKSPRLTARLLEKYPDTMGCLVFNQKSLLHKFIEDFIAQEDTETSQQLSALDRKIKEAHKKHGRASISCRKLSKVKNRAIIG